MKKIISAFAWALVLLVAGNASAQNKIGYIDVDQAVSIMPEIGRIDTSLQKFQADSLNSTLASLVQEYRYKDSILTKTDTSKMPASVKAQYHQDIENLAYQVQNWSQISQQVMQNKQAQLLQPVYRKINDAIHAVAKENGYGYILTKDALIVAPSGEDILPLVAKKLGVKLPPANQQQQASPRPRR